jgi:hypothetical protein
MSTKQTVKYGGSVRSNMFQNMQTKTKESEMKRWHIHGQLEAWTQTGPTGNQAWFTYPLTSLMMQLCKYSTKIPENVGIISTHYAILAEI